ncbi:MAG: hypothetical protein GX375_07170 [Clostridiales bacterium]|nr:hypothetical protein [Clostridiales bacterium]
MSKLLLNEQVTKEEWMQNKDKYNFVLVDKDLAGKTSISTAMTLAIIEWQGTLETSIIKRFTNASERSIKRHIKWLRDNGYLESRKFKPEEIKELVLNAEKCYKCEWCKKDTFMIHEHHYPIPKRQGGDKTVKLCPNCHSAYHKIELECNGGWDND